MRKVFVNIFLPKVFLLLSDHKLPKPPSSFLIFWHHKNGIPPKWMQSVACDTPFSGTPIGFVLGVLLEMLVWQANLDTCRGQPWCKRKVAYLLFYRPKCQIYTRPDPGISIYNIGCQLDSIKDNMFIWDAAFFFASPEATQISSTAWGKYVSAFWAEQDDRVARAEARLKWLGRMEGVVICSPGGLPMPGCGPYSRQARLLPHFLDPWPKHTKEPSEPHQLYWSWSRCP